MIRMLVLMLSAVFSLSAEAQQGPRWDPDGTAHVPAFTLPESPYFSEESRAAMKRFREVYGPEFFTFGAGCADLSEVAGDAEAIMNRLTTEKQNRDRWLGERGWDQ